MLGDEIAQMQAQPAIGKAGCGADRQRAGQPLLRHPRGGGGDHAERTAHVLGIGKGAGRDLGLVAAAFDDLEAEIGLEQSQLVADRAARDVQLGCGAPEGTVAGDTFDGTQRLNGRVAFDDGPRAWMPPLDTPAGACMRAFRAQSERRQLRLEEVEVAVRHTGIGPPAICGVLRHRIREHRQRCPR